MKAAFFNSIDGLVVVNNIIFLKKKVYHMKCETPSPPFEKIEYFIIPDIALIPNVFIFTFYTTSAYRFLSFCRLHSRPISTWYCDNNLLFLHQSVHPATFAFRMHWKQSNICLMSTQLERNTIDQGAEIFGLHIMLIVLSSNWLILSSFVSTSRICFVYALYVLHAHLPVPSKIEMKALERANTTYVIIRIRRFDLY